MYHSRVAHTNTNKFATSAVSEWGLFAAGPSAGLTTATTASASTDTASPTPSSSGPPDQSAVSPNQLVEPTRPSTVLDQPPNHPDYLSSQSDTPPTQPGYTSGQPGVAVGPLDTADLDRDGEARQFDPSDQLVTPTAFMPPEVNITVLPPTPDIRSPSPLLVPQMVHTRNPSPLGNGVTRKSANPPTRLLAGITEEPMWMKKKHTLDYFRSTTDFGKLSNIIEHWYELENLLGFPEAVSIYKQLVRHARS